MFCSFDLISQREKRLCAKNTPQSFCENYHQIESSMPTKNIKSTDVKHIYDKNYFQQGVTGHQEFIHFKGEYKDLMDKYREIVDIAQLSSKESLLDIGCGRGEIVLYHAKNKGVATGVDFADDAIQMAKSKAADLKIPCSFVCSSFQNINEKQSFDKIISLDFIEHLSQEEGEAFFRKCASILNKNGKVIIYTGPNTLRRKYGYPVIRFLLKLSGRKLPKKEADTTSEHYKLYHLNEQNAFTLKKMAEKAGFRNCSVSYSLHENHLTARKKLLLKTFFKHFFLVGLILVAEK